MGGVETIIDIARDTAWDKTDAGAEETGHGFAHVKQVTRAAQDLDPRDDR